VLNHEPIHGDHELDEKGNPAGGVSVGVGFTIQWQDGPIGQYGRNGAMLEEVLDAVIDRLRWLNEAADGKFRSRLNSLAITDLESAQNWLYRRTLERMDRDVEGTHQP
jgi:hypothetical protein